MSYFPKHSASMNVQPLLFALPALMFLLLAVDCTYAQERDSDLNLPEWAAPSEPEAYESSSSLGAESTAPDMPADPESVPVDGGLGLLAAAGAGYAMYRLNRREEAAGEEEGSSL